MAAPRDRMLHFTPLPRPPASRRAKSRQERQISAKSSAPHILAAEFSAEGDRKRGGRLKSGSDYVTSGGRGLRFYLADALAVLLGLSRQQYNWATPKTYHGQCRHDCRS